MALYLYDWSEPVFTVNDFNRFFDERSRGASDSNERQVQHSGGSQFGRGIWQPKMDLHESPESNVITATFELPGIKKEDINIDIRNNRLIISGEVVQSKEINEKGYVHRERQTGKFSRALPLPSGTQPNDIKASMEHGVLSVTFPKQIAQQVPQRITIQ